MWDRMTGPKIDGENIIVDSTMKSVTSTDAVNASQLLELAKLLKHKFNLNSDVTIRLKKPKLQEIDIVFEDNYYLPSVDNREVHENERPLDYLETFSGSLSIESNVIPHLSKSIYTVNVDECVNIINGLNLMADPTYKDIEEKINNVGLSKLC